MTTPHNRFTAGRYLQALARAKGLPQGAAAFAESQGQWLDRQQVVTGLRAAVGAHGTDHFPDGLRAIADAFISVMRSYSVPLRLMEFFRKVPMRTRLYINGGVTAVRVVEGAAIPALKGDWSDTTILPKKHAGLVVQTKELIESMAPAASVAITDDLAEAVAEAENRSFVNPAEAGSILSSSPNFAGTGGSVTQIDADLEQLIGLVPGAFRPGAAFVMTVETATALSLKRGTGGAAAYPAITPQGGTLQGLPVLVTSGCQETGSPVTRIIGLLSPSEIFWADEGVVELSTSENAALEMTDAPTGDSATGTAGTTSLVSMFQTNAVATRAVRESGWYPRTGAGAYFVAGF